MWWGLCWFSKGGLWLREGNLMCEYISSKERRCEEFCVLVFVSFEFRRSGKGNRFILLVGLEENGSIV